MTELTSRQILDAIDRTLAEISQRFANEAAQPVAKPAAGMVSRPNDERDAEEPSIEAEAMRVST
jgi:hypothetical protein